MMIRRKRKGRRKKRQIFIHARSTDTDDEMDQILKEGKKIFEESFDCLDTFESQIANGNHGNTDSQNPIQNDCNDCSVSITCTQSVPRYQSEISNALMQCLSLPNSFSNSKIDHITASDSIVLVSLNQISESNELTSALVVYLRFT